MSEGSTFAVFLAVTLAVIVVVGVISVTAPYHPTNPLEVSIYYSPNGFYIPCPPPPPSNRTYYGCKANYEVSIGSNQSGRLWYLTITGNYITKNITFGGVSLLNVGGFSAYWYMQNGWEVGDTVSVIVAFSPALQQPYAYKFQGVVVKAGS